MSSSGYSDELPGGTYLSGAQFTGSTCEIQKHTPDTYQGNGFFEYRLERAVSTVRIRFFVVANPVCAVRLFYCTEHSQNEYSDERMYILGTSGTSFEAVIAFPSAVTSLRFCPVESDVVFALTSFSLEALDVCLPANNAPFGWLPGALAHVGANVEKTVCLFTHDTGASGAPMLCRKIGEQLRALGWTVVVFSFTEPDAQDFTCAADLFFVCPQTPWFINLWAQGLRQAGVHYAVMNTVVTGIWAKPLHNEGFATTALVHEMSTAIRMMLLQDSCKKMQQHCDRLIFPSEIVAQDFEWITGQTVDFQQKRILPYGYYRKEAAITWSDIQKDECKKRYGIPENAVVLCGSGVIHIAKGLDLLSFVVAHLAQQGVSAHVLWMGYTSQHEYKGWVESQFAKMGLGDRLHFTGYISDEDEYSQILACSDVFVLPSREDSMPSVLMEAMAAQIPIVAFKGSGGAQDLLQNGRGALVSYLDVYAFASEIFRLLERPEERAEMVQRAYQYYKQYGSFREYVEKIVLTFQDIPLAPMPKIPVDCPLYSIVLAHYNQLDTIRASLDSILGQTYPRIELIVMDDATAGYSEENILLYIEENKGLNIENVVFVSHAANLGTTRALNRAIEKVTGEYLHIFAADDVLATSFVAENFIRQFGLEAPEVEIITAEAVMYDRNLEKCEEVFAPRALQEKYGAMSAKEQFLCCTQKNIFPIAASCMRTSLFRRLGPFDERIRLVEDWPFFLHILRQGVKVHVAFFPALHHRAGGVSYSILASGSPYDLQFRADRLRTMELKIIPFLESLPIEIQMQLYQGYVDDVQQYRQRGGEGTTFTKAQLLAKAPTLKKRKIMDYFVCHNNRWKDVWSHRAFWSLLAFAAAVFLAQSALPIPGPFSSLLAWAFILLAICAGAAFLISMGLCILSCGLFAAIRLKAWLRHH